VSWGPARAAWRRALRGALTETTRDTAFAVADIQDCYGSISPETIATLLGPEAAPAVDFLKRIHERGARGLPIGPDPSAILANAVLSELDRAIRNTGARHLRWVDDIVLWGSRGDVGSALRSLDDVAARMGLALHPVKTRFLTDLREPRTVALGERDSSIIAAP
jgi:reverse transcriptase-like protein